MRRTTLTAAALLGLAAPLLASGTTTAPATAAGETCRGQAATIVGTGRPIVGTEGPDVVVTNGAASVRTLGGDDLVCVTGSVPVYVTVVTGDGDDVVDGTTARDEDVSVSLGSGTDTFHGGDDDDRVHLDYPDPGTGPDVIHAGGGADELWLRTGPGAAVIDNAAGRFSSAGELRTTWSGVEEFWLAAEPAPRDLTVTGSDAPERVYDQTLVATTVSVDLRGGDDGWFSGVAPAPTSRLDGGAGRDLLYVASDTGALDLDLREGSLRVGAAGAYVVAAGGFEDAEVFAEHVVLAGTDGPNLLGLTACDGTVRGRGGDDRVARAFEGVFELFDADCGESLTINGGAGDDDVTGSGGPDTIVGGKGRDRLNGRHGSDRLVGGRGHDHLSGREQRDTLLGGPGRDVADGGRGSRDLCRAERERRCER